MKDAFWSQIFCLLSAGGATIETIRQYIESQGEKKEPRRKNKDLSKERAESSDRANNRLQPLYL